jgi:hypothetical protein
MPDTSILIIRSAREHWRKSNRGLFLKTPVYTRRQPFRIGSPRAGAAGASVEPLVRRGGWPREDRKRP